MHTDLKKTLAAVDRCLPTEGESIWEQLHCMYDLALRLMSQELAVIYDKEMFGSPTGQRPLAEQRSTGANIGSMITLTIQEPLSSMKKPTEALENTGR